MTAESRKEFWIDRSILILGVLLAAWSIAIGIKDSDPTTFGLDILGMTILGLAVFAVCAGLLVFRLLRRPEGERLSFLATRPGLWMPLLVFPACLLLCGLGFFRQVRFKLSQADLQAAASSLPPSDAWNTADMRVGLYAIHRVRKNHEGQTFFDLGGCGMLDHCFFVYDPRDSDPGLLQPFEQLDPHWWLLMEPF